MQGPEELGNHLREQIEFLSSSTSAFDRGFEGEAKRMSVVIRLLVHDTSQSRSLLSQLMPEPLSFYDSAGDWNPENLLTHHGLALLRIGGGDAAFSPTLDNLPPGAAKWVSFPTWWKKVVLVDGHRTQFSRKDLVLTVANQDGGAHVDPKLDPAYAELSRRNSINWFFENGASARPLTGRVELVSIRQIAHEVLRTLERQGFSTR